MCPAQMSEAGSAAQRACIRVLDDFRPFENSNCCRTARATLSRRCSAAASCTRALDAAAAAAAIDIFLLILKRSDASLQEEEEMCHN